MGKLLRKLRLPLNYTNLSVRCIALLTALMGVVNVVSAITPALLERTRLLTPVFPLEVRHSSRLSTVLAGFALLMLAGNLGRRKRIAWLITAGVLIITAVSHLLKGLDYEEAFFALLLDVWLIALYPVYHVRSDQTSIQKGIRVLLAAVGFTLVYGTLGFYVLDRHFSITFNLITAILQTFTMFAEFNDPGLEPVTEFGRFFAGSIYSVAAFTIGYSLLLVLRPVFRMGRHVTAMEKERANTIVGNYGCSSLARITLFPDKVYFFSTGGSLFAYVNKGRVALVLGDPIGPDEDAAPAIREFLAFCSANDWQPAFYQAQPRYLAAYQSIGLNAVCIGQEAVVDLSAFTLGGKKGSALRTPVNRLTKLGYTAQVHEPPLADGLIAQLRAVSEEWLIMMRGSEKQFSLGYFDVDYIRECAVITVNEPEGQIMAFANIITEYRRNEVAVDLMRRRRDIVPGTMEFLFVEFFEWAKLKGYSGFSLGLSALSGVGAHPDAPRVERALYYIYEHINQFYNFKGLHQFKEKFNPRWEPRFLICPNLSSLPLILTALIRADSGDDFWMYLLRSSRRTS